MVNYKQIIGIVIAVLSVLAVSSTNLSDLFGAGVAKSIVSFANLATAVLGSVLAAYTSNTSTVRDAQSVQGVDNISINKSAPQGIAALAMDPTLDNVSPVAADRVAVANTAEGNTTK